VLDYSSGSFTDFILGDQADPAGPGLPIPEPVGPGPAKSQPVRVTEGPPEPWRYAHAEVLASLPP